MAFSRVFVVFMVIVTIVPKFNSAKEFIVGDDSGWTINFDYKAWAEGKDFQVGDTLVFNYPVGVHNVFRVNGTDFQNCSKPPLSEALRSGNDKIVLATPGRKWYICGVAKHCENANQKLFINVLPQTQSPGAAPAPSPIYTKFHSSRASKRPFIFW
ncbi:stellacyanin-like [Pistacia vera]|nr:stellacyanin-like [Pistacia vera]